VFADKGIPSLESVKFADEEESEPEETEGSFRRAATPEAKTAKNTSYQSNNPGGTKRKFRAFRDLGVGETLLGVAAVRLAPFIVAGALATKAGKGIRFDGRDEVGGAWETTTVDTSNAVTPASISRDPRTRPLR